MSDATHTDLVRPTAPLFDEARLAVGAFLARYGAPTRQAYACDLRAWFGWCHQHNLTVFGVQRPHVELWAREMEEVRGLAKATVGRRLSTLAGFYRVAVIDGHLEHSPLEFVRRPKISDESANSGPGSHGTRRLHRPRRSRRCHRPRPGMSARATGPAGRRGMLDQHRRPRLRTWAPHRHRSRQGIQARRHPAAAPRRPRRRPSRRRPRRRTAAAVPIGTTARPPRRHPHRPPPRQARRDRPSTSPPTRYDTASSPPPSTPASRSVTCRSPPVTPTPVPPPATTAPATTSTATPATSSPHSSPEPRDEPPCTRHSRMPSLTSVSDRAAHRGLD